MVDFSEVAATFVKGLFVIWVFAFFSCVYWLVCSLFIERYFKEPKIEQLLALPKDNRSAIVLRKITRDGKVLFDLRRCAILADGAFFVPTSRGVYLTEEQFSALAEYMRQGAH